MQAVGGKASLASYEADEGVANTDGTSSAAAPACVPIAEALEQMTAQPGQQLDRDMGPASAAEVDWQNWVRHNWVPVLSLALGPQWQSKYESEVAAIIALQLSVQPSGGEAADGSAPSSRHCINASSASAHQNRSTPAHQHLQPQQHTLQPPASGLEGCLAAVVHPRAALEQLREQPLTAPGPLQPNGSLPMPPQFPPGLAAGLPARAFPLDSVDVDGKRRRLRRKRAASPDLSPPAPSQGGSSYGQDRQSTRVVDGSSAVMMADDKASSRPSPSTAPQEGPGGREGAGCGGGSVSVSISSGSFDDNATLQGAAAAGASQQQPAPVLPALQAVVSQVSQLSLGGGGGTGGGRDGAPVQHLGRKQGPGRRGTAQGDGAGAEAASGAGSGQPGAGPSAQEQGSKEQGHCARWEQNLRPGAARAGGGGSSSQAEVAGDVGGQAPGPSLSLDESAAGLAESLAQGLKLTSTGGRKPLAGGPIAAHSSIAGCGALMGASSNVGDGHESPTSVADAATGGKVVSPLPAVPGVGGGEAGAAASSSSSGGGGRGGSDEGQRLLQCSLLDGLGLVQDLSRRIVTDLKEVAEERGLSLPQQVSEGGPLPLSVLLGGALVDRMDLLGRAAIHVAAASGRADVVRQLAAAGCAVNKALPMDFRLLLERHPELDPSRPASAGANPPSHQGTPATHHYHQQQQQQQGQQDWERGGQQGHHDQQQQQQWQGCQEEQTRPFSRAPAPSQQRPPAKRRRHVTGSHVPPVAALSLQYCTALHLAAVQSHVAVVEALLEAPGCDVNARNREGATPLHAAAYVGASQVVALLSRAPGVLVDARDHHGRTPLHLAAAASRDDVVVELWAKGAAIDAPDIYGWTALHYAARAGHAEVAGKLIIAGSHVQASGLEVVSPAHLAAERGHASIVEKLLLAGYVPDTPLSHSMGSGKAQAQAPEQLAQQAPPSCPASPGAAAAGGLEEGGLEGGSAAFADAGLDNDSSRSTSSSGGSSGQEGPGAAGDPPSRVPGWSYGHEGDGDVAGATALHLAAAGGHLDVIDILLRAGANPQQGDAKGRTPLDVAVESGQFLVCPRLLDAGCRLSDSTQHAPPAGAPAAATDPAAEASASGGSAAAAPLPAGPAAAAAPAAASLDDMLRWLGTPSDDLVLQQHPALATLSGCEQVGSGPAAPTFLECAAAAGKLGLVSAFLAQRGAQRGSLQQPQEDEEQRSTASGAAHSPSEGALLAAAVRGGALGVAGWLLERAGGAGAEGAQCLLGQQPLLLHVAAEADDRDMVQLLLAVGSDPRRKDASGRTALHPAASAGADSALLLLSHLRSKGWLEAAAVADDQGWTPLHYAAAEGLTEVAAELATGLGSARDATTTREGATALHLAARAGHAATAYALLEAKCSAAVPDRRGWLPLHYVAQQGDLAFFNLLFALAAPHLTPAAGAALLTCAVHGGSSEMVGILLLTGVADAARCAAAGELPVHAAAREGFVDALRYLQGTGFAVAGVDDGGLTPLHHAPLGFQELRVPYKRGVDHTYVAGMLVAAGCPVDARDGRGRSPLHLAAGAGCSEMAARLLELSAGGFDAEDCSGWTPLFWACSGGHAPAAKALLARGANPWALDHHGRLPLHHAAEGGHLGCVRALARAMQRTRGAGGDGAAAGLPSLEVQDAAGDTPLALAAEHGHPECVAVLLERSAPAPARAGAPPAPAAPTAGPPAPSGAGAGPAGPSMEGAAGGDRRRTALHLAAARGLLDIAQKMLATRRCHANAKDADGWLPLHHAAAGGHAPLAQLLLAAHSDVDDVAHDGETALHKAALGGHLTVVQLLVRARCQVDVRNASGSTPLYNASSQGHVAVLQELISAGATVDAPTTNGCTPLYIAANNGFPEAAALLLEAGANPDGETHSGCSPLHAAALNGHAPAVSVLLEHGCELDLQSQNGSSPLHNAASAGHLPAVDALLGAGADCDVQNGNGNTPLHLCAAKGWAEVAEALLAAGADVHIRNCKGWTAAQSAANSGYFDVVLRLVQHGAAWRHKGDSDVVKLLSKKSSYKPSYIEGRLRLAEKELHRRRQQAQQAQQGSTAGADASADAQAAADAVMQELLRAEREEKERAERQKAKKQAKRQQRKQHGQRAQQGEPQQDVQQEQQQGWQQQQPAMDEGPAEGASMGASVPSGTGPGKRLMAKQPPAPPQQQQRRPVPEVPNGGSSPFDDSANEHTAGASEEEEEDGGESRPLPPAVHKPAPTAAAVAAKKATGVATVPAGSPAASSRTAPIAVPAPGRQGNTSSGGSSKAGTPAPAPAATSPVKGAGASSSRAAPRGHPAQQQQQPAAVGMQRGGASPVPSAATGFLSGPKPLPSTRKASPPATASSTASGGSRPAAAPAAGKAATMGPSGAQHAAAAPAPAPSPLRPAGPYAAALVGSKPLPAAPAPPPAAPARSGAWSQPMAHLAAPAVPASQLSPLAPPTTSPAAATAPVALTAASAAHARAASAQQGPAPAAVAAEPARPPAAAPAQQGDRSMAGEHLPAAASPFAAHLGMYLQHGAAAVPASLEAPARLLAAPPGPPYHPLPAAAALPTHPLGAHSSLLDLGAPTGQSLTTNLGTAAAGLHYSAHAPQQAGPMLPSGAPGATPGALPPPGAVAAPAVAARAGVADPFVPLFGLQLPSMAGLSTSVDWSMPSAAAFGTSPLQAGYAEQVMSVSLPATPAALRSAGAGAFATGSLAGSMARGYPAGGSRSGGSEASGTSSVASEADELLNGIHSHVIHALAAQQAHHGAFTAAAAPLKRQPQASPRSDGSSNKPYGSGVNHVLLDAEANDGIDDVLRLQPWLVD